MNLKQLLNIYRVRRLQLISRGGIILPASVLIVELIITGFEAQSTRKVNQRDFEAGVTQQTDSIGAFVESSMKGYGQRLIAAAAFMDVKPDASANDWHTFYQQSQYKATLSSLLGIGYVTVLNQDEISGRAQDLKTSLGTNLVIFPEGERSVYAPITYIEPLEAYNQKAIGYDMYTDESRRAAMERARDTGELSMSAPVLLVQDKGQANPYYGVLAYYPVYRTLSPVTVEERRAALKGFAYIVVRPHDIVSGYSALSTERFKGSHISLNDITHKPSIDTLYAQGKKPSTRDAGAYTSHNVTELFGRTWDMSVTRTQLTSRQYSPVVIVVLGTTLSLLLAGLSYLLFARRLRAIQSQYEGEVQRTKDELLALASHQLRTPASAVKQYLGMLMMGMGGELASGQKMLAEKAYDTNERQLHIVNELLYVSKLDAGQLVIDPKVMNLTQLVQKCIDDYTGQAAEKTCRFFLRRNVRIMSLQMVAMYRC